MEDITQVLQEGVPLELIYADYWILMAQSEDIWCEKTMEIWNGI